MRIQVEPRIRSFLVKMQLLHLYDDAAYEDFMAAALQPGREVAGKTLEAMARIGMIMDKP